MDVRNLTHRYASARSAALDQFNLTIQPGEIFGILGPNGGGKSTLFKILATLVKPSAGEVRFFGVDALRSPQQARAMLGIVFQHPSIDIKLTAEENIHCHGRLHGLGGSDLRERITRQLSAVGLADRRRDLVQTFSGGMRRRLELAKATLHQPRILLLDEADTGLDPAGRRDLWRQLRQLRDQAGTTILLTTHLMEEADRCDRLAIISRGRGVAVNTPANLKRTIGGDVVTLWPTDPADPDSLCMQITSRFGPWRAGQEPKVLDGVVRFEHPTGPALLARITTDLPHLVQRVAVGQPTLEDVFIHLTGDALHAESPATISP